jgi:hypothetical protein
MENRGIALLFVVKLGTLDGVGGQHHAPAAFTPVKDPVTIVLEAWWASEPVWTGAENPASTGIFFCALYFISTTSVS